MRSLLIGIVRACKLLAALGAIILIALSIVVCGLFLASIVAGVLR